MRLIFDWSAGIDISQVEGPGLLSQGEITGNSTLGDTRNKNKQDMLLLIIIDHFISLMNLTGKNH